MGHDHKSKVLTGMAAAAAAAAAAQDVVLLANPCSHTPAESGRSGLHFPFPFCMRTSVTCCCTITALPAHRDVPPKQTGRVCAWTAARCTHRKAKKAHECRAKKEKSHRTKQDAHTPRFVLQDRCKAGCVCVCESDVCPQLYDERGQPPPPPPPSFFLQMALLNSPRTASLYNAIHQCSYHKTAGESYHCCPQRLTSAPV